MPGGCKAASVIIFNLRCSIWSKRYCFMIFLTSSRESRAPSAKYEVNSGNFFKQIKHAHVCSCIHVYEYAHMSFMRPVAWKLELTQRVLHAKGRSCLTVQLLAVIELFVQRPAVQLVYPVKQNYPGCSKICPEGFSYFTFPLSFYCDGNVTDSIKWMS